MLGLPDENYGEIVCAIIVPEVEAKRKQKEELRPAISLEDLSAWAKDKLAPYKVLLTIIHFFFSSFGVFMISPLQLSSNKHSVLMNNNFQILVTFFKQHNYILK